MNSLFTILQDIQINVPQSQLQHSFVLCGQPQSGKSTIVSKLTSQQIQDQAGLIYAQQKTNIIGYQAVLQYFEISGQAFKQLLTLPLNKQSYQQYSYVLVIDLSDNPHEILNVCNAEIRYIREETEKKLQQSIDVDTFKQLELNIYDKIMMHHDKNRIVPLYVPIIIVGWKYDLFSKNLDLESRKWITRGLRYLAHTNNCSLVFGSNQDYQFVRQTLQYHVKPTASIYQYDHLKQICITQLSDSIENINLPPSGNNPLDGFNKIIKDQIVAVVNNQKKKKQSKITEEDWNNYKEEKIDRLIKQFEFQQKQTAKQEESVLI
ncbi:unnamed protein product (macronuclear) [Paramecium tetraurelia]|uniref:Cytoplasmic dynein 2 light intermediate chain 1 n=1 Tax=Paramecium tetraurelia TaxID=5888 RepID=A0CQL5_PARTE|nr:uncharacterized protein GSPATT00009430001 [Paramecium tetraurelia]CAK73082.1 unnamed protein product [Paramecium tetraurelia]|eukprot:XP_001440479.1 hypothetical protein (macronuclear) [Paramecium tetraurelia strain d4-2]